MRLHRDRVKRSSRSEPRKPFSRRWLEGWELLIPSVGIAALAAWLALPQPTLPTHLPLPTLEPYALEAARERLFEQAVSAKRQPLPFEIRAAGERFRQLGQAVRRGTALSVDERQRYRAQLSGLVTAFGTKPLLDLRAIQTELFLAALARWETTGVESPELSELGGDFVQILEKEHLATRPLGLNADERRALFLLRWTDLAGLNETPELRLDPVWIILSARFRLRVPLNQTDHRSLSVINRLMTAAPDYPGDVARGLVLARMGAHAAAAERFAQFIAEHPDAPYSTRARNHLVWVNQRLEPYRP